MKKILALILGISTSMSWFLGGALPVLAADTIVSSVYLDTNNNGTIDTIRWTLDENVTACAYEAGDWTVNTAGDMTVVITGLTCTGADAILDINVTADANETGLQTSGGANPVISYANAVTAGSVTLTSGAMSAKANQATTDGAKPLITSAEFTTVTAGGINRNGLTINYSEVLVVSLDGAGDDDIPVNTTATSTATLGSMTAARTIAGVATWDAGSGGDMTTAAATDNRVSLGNGGLYIQVEFNFATAGYFNAGTTAPTTPNLTPVEDANDVTDLNNNAANSAQAVVAATNPAAWDVTVPTVTTTYSCDSDTDGDIDVMQIDFDDSMVDASLTVGDLELDNDSTNNATGEETVNASNTATSGCANSAINADADANDDKIQVSLTTGISGTNLAYFHNVTAGLRDDAGNRLAAGAELGTETDAADPLLSSSTPEDADTDVSRTGDIVLNFTEPIDTGTFDVDLTTFGGTLAATWSGGDSTVTLNPSSTLSGSTDYTITINTADDDAVGNTYGGGVTGVTEPFTFTTASSSSSGGGGGSTASPTYYINLSFPEGGETLTPGETEEITWETSGTGTVNFVNLYYTLDGSTYTTIEAGSLNDGHQDWIVPSTETSTAKIRVEATDLASALATDTSSAFTIGSTTDDSTDEDTTDEVTAPGTNIFGNSPVTGEIEEISDIDPGDYFKAVSYDTVYYLAADGTRRPFNDSQTFFTWQTDFDDVLIVTDATLPVYALGAPMLPKPGVVLIKITSDVDVYAVEVDPSNSNKALKRLIATEELAASLYGSNWADYVIDVDVTLFGRFTLGTPIDDGYDPDLSIMKKRVNLH